MSKITIATAPCSWGVWYADGTPSGASYTTFLEQARAAGYKSLELGPDGYLPTDKRQLLEVLDSNNLTVCGGTVCYQFDKEKSFESFRDRVAKLCRRIKALDAKYLVAMDESDVGQYSEKKKDMSAAVWNDFLEKINQLGRFAKEEYGIEVVYHPHFKSMIETEEEIIRLMEYTKLTLCFDIGHHVYVNGNGEIGETSALDFIRKHPEKIEYLHFKNVDYNVLQKVRQERLSSDTAFDLNVMCDLEDGIVDYQELKKVLDEISYTGIGVIEQDMPRATAMQAFETAKRNLEYLRRIQIIP
jgi:inosose dehydratase